MKQQHPDVDMVYFTGDVIDQPFWNSSVEEVSDDLHRIYRLFNLVLGNTKFYPALGNQDTYPTNL